MDDESFTDLFSDRMEGVQRSHRFLKNHADHAPSYLEEFAIIGTDHIHAIDGDATRRMISERIGQQLQYGERRHGFSGTTFSDQRQRFAGINRKRDATNCRIISKAHVKVVYV